jgi:hypothetical protein
MARIDYGVSRPRKTTRKGTRPNDSKKRPVIGSGRNRPADGYDPITKTWNHQKP